MGAASRFTGKRVHFTGIGGCGMSGLARILLDAGALVSGSDTKFNAQTIELTRRGATISRDQLGELLSSKVDLVVRTAAIPDTNHEFLAAKALGIPTIKYAQLLGQVMQERLGVAVAGTHGKSTTTAMISYALLTCGADPSFVIGGSVKQLDGGSRSGSGRAFVVEACEYDRSFHNLHPRIAVITNIESEHLDYYKDIDQIMAAFRQFAQLVPDDGLILANGKDSHVLSALAGLATPTELAALAPGFVWSTRITGIEKGCYRGQVSYKGRPAAELRMSVPGEHNLANATLALATCCACGIEAAKAAAAIGDFLGVDRRLSEIGRCNGAIVVDDYGHHPTEIRSTLKAAREKYNPRRLFCVFQPHQHSRTRCLLGDFAVSFEQATQTIVPDIYFVRDSEAERQLVSSRDLVACIQRNGQRAVHLPEFSAIVDYVRHNAREGDLILTMGAGNVWEIARDLVEDT
jgi:UDP-N-acetylmuramate--alanine ligase